MSDAIRKDVSETAESSDVVEQAPAEVQPKDLKETDPKARPARDRDQRMEEIVQRLREENGTAPAPEPEPEPEVTQDETPQQPEPVAAAAQDDPLKDLGYYRNSAGQLVTKLKVNGLEREVSAEQLRAYVQKDIAADIRLQQAADRDRRLQAREAEIERRAKQLEQSLTQERKTPEEKMQAAKAVLSKLYDGDEDEAAKSLVELLESGRQQNVPTFDESKITSLVSRQVQNELTVKERQRRAEEWSKSTEQGIKALRENEMYKPIATDPNLWNLVDAKTEEYLNKMQGNDPEFTNKMPAELIEMAAKDVMDWYSAKANVGKPSAQRQERKQTISRTPQARATAHQQPKEPEIDMSPAAVIARMRAGRPTQ